jgi:hypothetical protein
MSVSGEFIPAGRLRGIPTIVVEGLSRQANGLWTFHIRSEGGVEIDDGRRVLLNRHIAARATEQLGRRRSRKPAA